MDKNITMSDLGQFIIETINSVVTNYEMNDEIVNKKNKECQDFLHSLELDNLKYAERAKLATKLQKNRNERRKSKDVVEGYSGLYNVLNYMQNKKVILNFANELIRYDRLQENKHTRKYVKRIK